MSPWLPGSVRIVDDASQLAEISWPVVGQQGLESLRRKTGSLCSAALVGPFEQVLCQEGKLVTAFAQGTKPNNQSGQGEIKLGSKLFVVKSDFRVVTVVASSLTRVSSAATSRAWRSRGSMRISRINKVEPSTSESRGRPAPLGSEPLGVLRSC